MSSINLKSTLTTTKSSLSTIDKTSEALLQNYKMESKVFDFSKLADKKIKHLANGNAHIGERKDGKPHGFGIMIYTDGSINEGSWNLGKREGLSFYKMKNGNIFLG
jgi:hypothetical protein